MISLLQVNNDPSLLELSKKYLEWEGEFRVDTILSVPEALTLTGSKNSTPFSEYAMPVMDGIPLLNTCGLRGLTYRSFFS